MKYEEKARNEIGENKQKKWKDADFCYLWSLL